MLGEVRGAVSERTLMDLLFAGDAQLSDAIADHLGEGLPLIGRGEPVSAAREALHDEGAVLVVDGGGSLESALVGDLIAASAVENGWAGIIVHGAIRDRTAIGALPLGVKALGSNPRKSAKDGVGEVDADVRRPVDRVVGDAQGLSLIHI